MINDKVLKAFRYLPFLWILLLIVMSSIPGSSLNVPQIRHLDKVVHFSAFSVLCMLFCFRYYYVKKAGLKIVVLKSGIYSFIYGIFEETYQYFIPERYSDLYDLIADAAGITFSLLIFYILYRKKILPHN